MRMPARNLFLAANLLALSAVFAFGGCKSKVASGNADGREVFATACARCHGAGGVPAPARAAQLGVKDLTSADLQQALGDDDIRERIMRGSMNRRMPAFGSKLSKEQVDSLVLYIRSLGPK